MRPHLSRRGLTNAKTQRRRIPLPGQEDLARLGLREAAREWHEASGHAHCPSQPRDRNEVDATLTQGLGQHAKAHILQRREG